MAAGDAVTIASKVERSPNSMEVRPARTKLEPARLQSGAGQVTDQELHEALHALRVSQPDIGVEEALHRMKDEHPQWLVDVQRAREAMRAMECSQPSLTGGSAASSLSPSIDRKLHDKNSSYSLLSGLDSLQDLAARDVGDVYKYDAKNLDTNVVIVASEVEPWSKSGGLAIVACAYAYEFAMRGHKRVMCVSPR